MAKKKNKKDKKDSAPSDPVEAIRAAVERTFHATTDSAAGTQKRTRQLVDEVTHAAARIRATIEELRVLDEVKGLRNDIEALGRRVAALESGPAKPAPSRSTAKPAASRSTAKPAASRSTAKTASASSRAKPAAARKPRTARSSSASTRSRSARSGGSSS
jgi:predicted  nucleic acid-binding Zn-ribbon protein